MTNKNNHKMMNKKELIFTLVFKIKVYQIDDQQIEQKTLKK